ncbi:MAG: hypothetical protein QM723_29375 [Myxococcaceae bacterium]
MKFARFEVDRPPGADTTTVRGKLKGAEGFSKEVELLVLTATAPRETVDRFIDGGARLAELVDGNLLQIVEVGYEQGRAFLASELSSGETVVKLLSKCRELGLDSMPAAIALGIGSEVAKALAHAHAHTDVSNKPDPITHGALRSESITVDGDGGVKLGGFVPWRSAPSAVDDLESLVELVATWVAPAERERVREAAGAPTSAAELRRSWAAFVASRWPNVAPDARRTLVAFANGEAPRALLESRLRSAPNQAAGAKTASIIGTVAAAVALSIATALLLREEPAPPAVVVAPLKKPLVEPQLITREPPYHWSGEVIGADDHLFLPEHLPGVRFREELWFSELDPNDGHAPQLFIAETLGRTVGYGTVPVRPWRVPGATELRFFSWEPFEERYRPGFRSIALSSSNQKVLPLVQEWLEVTSPGVKALGVPEDKVLVVEVAPADARTPLGALLVAVSYVPKAPPAKDPRWPYQLSRMVLMSGQTSPSITGALQFAFIATNPQDHFRVTISEGANTREELWPAAQNEPTPTPTSVAVELEGHYEGFSQPGAVRFVGSCASSPELSQECIDRCVARFPRSYLCWRYYAQKARLDVDRNRGARGFLDAVEAEHLDHPFMMPALQMADIISGEKEPAPPAPTSPAKR